MWYNGCSTKALSVVSERGTPVLLGRAVLSENRGAMRTGHKFLAEARTATHGAKLPEGEYSRTKGWQKCRLRCGRTSELQDNADRAQRDTLLRNRTGVCCSLYTIELHKAVHCSSSTVSYQCDAATAVDADSGQGRGLFEKRSPITPE
jgi:hypothetical protein